MQIHITQPHADYPLAWVNVYGISKRDLEINTGVLADQGITLLGPWEVVSAAPSGPRGLWGTFRAPALLENEHVKARKKAPAKRVGGKSLKRANPRTKNKS